MKIFPGPWYIHAVAYSNRFDSRPRKGEATVAWSVAGALGIALAALVLVAA